MQTQRLIGCAQVLVTGDRGLLAMDERTGGIVPTAIAWRGAAAAPPHRTEVAAATGH